MPKKRKPADISQGDWDAVESPPLTKAQLAELRPMSDAHKALWRKAQKAARGRPPQGEAAKQQVTLRLDADVLSRFKEGGAGWQTRINSALREAASGRYEAAPAKAAKPRPRKTRGSA